MSHVTSFSRHHDEYYDHLHDCHLQESCHLSEEEDAFDSEMNQLTVTSISQLGPGNDPDSMVRIAAD